MIKKNLELDFGSIFIHENVLIAELKEGILFSVENNRKLLELGRDIFEGRPYGYVSYRTNSYAVDPLVYMESSRAANLIAIAVVSNNELVKLNARQVEQKFYKNPGAFEVFDTLEEALVWMKPKF
ncbi:hypothetical protein RM553_02660 [Zunongwangia sp. F363]|uniref:STAS/SEC14 domain-containing protein n=1 Tax=Autumnicola tepida TaxID=3075595 RepID=A0ABU3C5U6_9FLAO|nr:hypothetical protein [Zunongwangia sp. F363]MDT0641723.1 hypothetical protein [Zunongwangia sp. F363]